MTLHTPRLVETYEHLLGLKQSKAITPAEFKERTNKLKKQQASIDKTNQKRREDRQKISEAKAEAEFNKRYSKISKEQNKLEVIKKEKEQNKKPYNNFVKRFNNSFDKMNIFFNKNPNINDLVTKKFDHLNDKWIYTGLDSLPHVIIDKKELKFALSWEKVLQLISKKIQKGYNYLLKINNTFVTINSNNINSFSEKLIQNMATTYYGTVTESNNSFEEASTEYAVTKTELAIFRLPKYHKIDKSFGAWFKYNHTLNFDFKRYGIYNVNDKIEYNDACLIEALQNGGLDNEKIEMIKIFVKDRNIPASDIEKICDKIECRINIKKNDLQRKTTYGKKYDRTFDIGLIDEHYFIIEPVNITSFAINNYELVKNYPNWNHIVAMRSNTVQRDSKRTIDSFDVVKLLMDNKDSLLVKINFENSNITSTQYYDKIQTTITNLKYDEKTNCIPVECSKIKSDDFVNVFFDVETYLNDEGQHIAYVICSYSEGRVKYFEGDYCAFNFLKSLTRNSRLIAHNANYDYRFIVKYLRNINEISRGNRLIGCSGKFFGIKVEIKDSYHLISKPLRDFPSSFKLENVVKEVMPYSLYNAENIAKRYLDIQYVLDNFISESDKEQFLNNIRRWNIQKDNTYDIVMYSIKYCIIDCMILEQGYNKFRSWMLECVNIDINKILTIASLAHRYFVNQGCYEGVLQLSGVPQLFIQGSVVGGRTMVSENEKKIVNKQINDFDAVSLYPSAMKRMDGFLKGKPKIIENMSYSWVSKQDGYFVDIMIKSVGINRKFPLMSIKQNGVRVFTNHMVGQTIRVDKYTLEDLIQFHGITFDILRGYYFDEGFNTKIKSTIKFLFNERLVKKKQDNPIQEVYKLIMNSGYGKSIMKAIDCETKIFDDLDKFNIYLSRNYNWIKEFTYFGDKVKAKVIKPVNDHYNIAQVGSMILSMSKRIMNEVMCLAEDNDIDLFYQDTDSIHLEDSNIKTLEALFKNKYSKDLIGKNLGQFHSDFQLDGCKDIVATKSIFLGKKCYIDKLEGKNSSGNIEEGYHIRMKGIPNSVLLYTCDKLGYKNPMEMYEDLFRGKKIEFDLTNDGSKANFKMNKDYTVNTLDIFKREICF